jgi:alcohol dehydrogenase class IV
MKKFYLRYNDVPSNPSLKFAKKILEKARGYKEIVSIGGGSTIDVGKYISYHLDIPHTAIPTTAGTGSEVTRFAVFVKDGKKFSMEDPKLIPENYKLEPERVVTLSSVHTSASGLDALSQSIESLWSPNSTKESRGYSKRAIKYIMSTLWSSYNHPTNILFRQMMLEAANLSGKAINITTTSICHAVSYPLTTMYNVPHGIGCAATLPYFIRYFEIKYIQDWEVEGLIESLNAKIRKRIDIDRVADAVLESSRSKNVPKPVNKELLCHALRESICR